MLFTTFFPLCHSQETSGIEVGGIINSNTTWVIENSPYNITTPLLVNSGITLTIEAGVVVYLSDTYLQVDGTLVARGTTEYPISLISTGDGLGEMFSSGTPVITFSSGSSSWNEQSETGSIIENAIITSTQRSHTLYVDQVSPKINNCTIIAKNNTWVIYLESGATTISGCSITAGEWAVAIGVASSDSNINNAKILRNTIKDSGCAIGIFVGSPIVEGNLIINNTGSAISGLGGIRIDGRYTNPIIRKNTIFGNSVGLNIWDTQSPLIENNNIVNNLEYNVYLHEFASDVNVANNWWGTNEISEINQSIRDFKNDFNLGAVNFIPILFEINLDAHSLPLMVDFSFPSESFYVYNQVDFDSSVCYGEYSDVDMYLWDFGDGNITQTTQPTISHRYQTPNDYQIILTIIDEFGFQNSTTKEITILPDNTPPSTNHNYDGTWKDSDFSITLSASDLESGVASVYYKINDGQQRSVSSNGQPQISLEGENNVVEFWSVDVAGNVEAVQEISEIKLDKTNPIIGDPITSPAAEIQADVDVQVSVEVHDSVSGVDEVLLSYSTDDGATWLDISMSFNSTIDTWEANIPGQQIWTNVAYKIIAYDNAGNIVSTDGTGINSYEVIPEFHSWTILLVSVLITIGIIVSKNRLDKHNKSEKQEKNSRKQ